MEVMTANALNNMKVQVIKDFDNYLQRLMLGYSDNYDKILHKISFIETFNYLDNQTPMYEFLINY